MKNHHVTLLAGYGSRRSDIQIVRNLFGCLVLLVLCSSCANVYIPGLRNVPLLSKRGEFQTTASIGNGMNVTAAVAITNHIGILGEGMYANDKWRHYENSYRVHQSAEGGIGYFGNRNQFSYEFYAGYGGGKGNSTDVLIDFWIFGGTEQHASASYRKVFAQPTFGFRIKRVQLAITSRATAVDFSRLVIIENGRTMNMPRKRFYVFEPSFTAKFMIREGRTSFYGFAQTGLNVTEQPTANESVLPYAILHYNVGFGLRL